MIWGSFSTPGLRSNTCIHTYLKPCRHISNLLIYCNYRSSSDRQECLVSHSGPVPLNRLFNKWWGSETFECQTKGRKFDTFGQARGMWGWQKIAVNEFGWVERNFVRDTWSQCGCVGCSQTSFFFKVPKQYGVMIADIKCVASAASLTWCHCRAGWWGSMTSVHKRGGREPGKRPRPEWAAVPSQTCTSWRTQSLPAWPASSSTGSTGYLGREVGVRRKEMWAYDKSWAILKACA